MLVDGTYRQAFDKIPYNLTWHHVHMHTKGVAYIQIMHWHKYLGWTAATELVARWIFQSVCADFMS